MSFVTIIWFMVASACLRMAVLHGLVWTKQRTEWGKSVIALTALPPDVRRLPRQFASLNSWGLRPWRVLW